jgi:ATP-dependent Clp protease ATP-binding subunit ClpA
MGSPLIELPEGLVPEARTIALEMGLRSDATPVHLLVGLLLRRNDLLLVILEDARVHVGQMRLELEERIAEGRVVRETDNKSSLRFVMNQGVIIAQRYGAKRATGEHMGASIIENHPNAASRAMMERGVSMDVAKRWVRNELTAESGKEDPEFLMKRIARRLEGRCRVRLPAALLNRLVVLAEEHLGPDAATDRGDTLVRLVQTLAAEVMQAQMPPSLRELHLSFTDAKRRNEEAQKIGKTTTRRRSLMDELRSRENYLRSLADWLEKQPWMECDDESIRRAIAATGGIPVSKIKL